MQPLYNTVEHLGSPTGSLDMLLGVGPFARHQPSGHAREGSALKNSLALPRTPPNPRVNLVPYRNAE